MRLLKSVLAVSMLGVGACGTTDQTSESVAPDDDADAGGDATSCRAPECIDTSSLDGGSGAGQGDDGASAPVDAEAESSCIVLGASPPTVGPVRPGESAESVVVVENCSLGVPLTLRSWGLTLDSSPAFSFVSPLTLPLVVGPGQNIGVPVEYAPTLNGADERARFGVLSDAAEEPTLIELFGVSSESVADCVPAAITCTIEGDTESWPVGYVAAFDGVVTCTSNYEQGRPGMSFSWSLDAPTDPPPELSILGQRTAQFAFAEPGLYALSLDVLVDGEPVQCGAPTVRYEAKYVGEIVVEFQWELSPGAPAPPAPPLDVVDAPDLDLHFLNTGLGCWGDLYADCHARNSNPDWGELSVATDDPALVARGWGFRYPEVVTLSNPESTTYAVGVEYVDDRGYGGAEATVNVYIDDVLRFTAARAISEAGFWHVADINGRELTVERVDQLYPTIGTPRCE